MIEVTASCQAANRLLDLLQHNIKQRQKLAREMGNEVRKQAGQNIKQQVDVPGRGFEKRKNARKKRRLLLKLAAPKNLKVISRAPSTGGGGGVVVGYKNRLVGEVAYRHQHGVPEEYTPQKLAREKGKKPEVAFSEPCTPKQARALLKEGYMRPKHTKKGTCVLTRPSSAWIQKNMTMGHAGLVLRVMRTGSTKGKKSWLVEVPPRSFLGVNEAQTKSLLDKMIKKILQRAK